MVKVRAAWLLIGRSLASSAVTVTALDENDQEVQMRTFTNVPLRNGYKTTYRGTFFIDTPVTSGFTVNEWNEYDVVDF